jgi:hypothetical protein
MAGLSGEILEIYPSSYNVDDERMVIYSPK